MKPIEQYDAHVQSYKNEQKRKERERIRKILQYLAQKRKQLTLARHPVSQIYYNINMQNPVHIPPFAIRKVSFKHQIQPPIIQSVSRFKMSKYKYKAPDITNLDSLSTDVITHTVDYSHKGVPISIESIKKTDVPNIFLSSFIFSQQPLPNLELQNQCVLKHYDIPTPVLPDLSDAIPPLQTTPIKRSQFSYKLDTSIFSDFAAPLAMPFIHHPEVKYKARIADIKSSLVPIKFQIMKFGGFDTPQLFGTDVALQRIDTVIPNFRTEVGRLSVPKCEQKFTIPVFDFSETIDKLKKAVIADQMQGEYK